MREESVKSSRVVKSRWNCPWQSLNKLLDSRVRSFCAHVQAAWFCMVSPSHSFYFTHFLVYFNNSLSYPHSLFIPSISALTPPLTAVGFFARTISQAVSISFILPLLGKWVFSSSFFSPTLSPPFLSSYKFHEARIQRFDSSNRNMTSPHISSLNKCTFLWPRELDWCNLCQWAYLSVSYYLSHISLIS